MDIKGKTAIITGAANGIGKATAIRMANEGAKVVIIDRDESGANRLAGEIIKDGGKAMAFHADVRDSERIKQVISETISNFGDIDILVNNAGGPAAWSGKGYSLFIEGTEDTWKFVIEVNLLGTMIVTYIVLDNMIQRHKGKIINIGSVAGVNGLPRMVDYSAAKGGVIAFTRALAIELGEHGINVNCISPGSIESHEAGKSPMTFLRRTGKSEDVSNLILFLASDESDFITGQNYIIDGGRVLSTRCI